MNFIRFGAGALAGMVLLLGTPAAAAKTESAGIAEAAETAVGLLQSGTVVTLSGTLPAVKPGEAVALTVLPQGMEPGGAADSEITFAAQQATEDGAFSFAMDIGGATKELTAWLMLEYGASPVPYDFVYRGVTDIQQALALANGAGGAADMQAAFAKPIGEYTCGFILGADEDLLAQVLPPYTNIYQAVVDGKPYAVETFSRIGTIFENAVTVERISQSADSAFIRSELETKGEALGVIVPGSVYEELRASHISSQDRIYSRLAALRVSSAGALKQAYEESVFLAAVNSPVNGRFDVQYALERCQADLGLSDLVAKLKALSDTRQVKIYQDLMGKSYSTVSDFRTALEAAIAKESGGSDSGKKGTGGGSGGGRSPGITGGPTGDVTIYGPDNGQPLQPVQPDPETVFSDLSGAEWAAEAIEALYEKGIVSGRGEGFFAPNDSVTREEFLKMAVLCAGIQTSAEIEFKDVDAGEWYYPFIQKAVSAGLTRGIGGGLFGTGMEITRQDMAVMTYQAIQSKGLALADGGSADFTDADRIADYAASAVEALAKAGIISGNPDGSFAPEGTATRAEAAKLLYGILNLEGGERA